MVIETGHRTEEIGSRDENQPTTEHEPPEVLQQWQELVNQAVGWLREAKKICVEAVEAIATIW